MNKVIAKFEDRYGDERVVHKKPNGQLAIRREGQTVALKLNQPVAAMMGARIRAERETRGWTLAQLCERAGLATSSPKARMWEIEKGTRKEGVRLGTLYAIAAALEIEAADLMPRTVEVMGAASVRPEKAPRLRVGLGA